MANTHSLYSPSCLKRRMFCPASASIEQALWQENTASAISESGTRIHAYIEQAIKSRVSDNIALESLTDEEMALGQKCIAFAKDYTELAEVHTELPIVYNDINGTEVFHGTIDLVAIKDSRATIIDWKSGFELQEDAGTNPQGLAYALALMQMRPELEGVQIIFFYPRLNRTSIAFFVREEAEYFGTKVSRIINRCESQPYCFVSGDHCQYCRGNLKGTCPALNAKRAELAKRENVGVSIKDMTTENLAQIIEQCKAVSRIEDAVKDELMARIEAEGSPLVGYNVVEVSGGRECENIPAYFQCISHLVTQGEFLACCTLSLPKIEKLCGDKAVEKGQFTTKKEGIDSVKDITASLLKEKPPRKQLKKEKN